MRLEGDRKTFPHIVRKIPCTVALGRRGLRIPEVTIHPALYKDLGRAS